jgi:hypothetical protein
MKIKINWDALGISASVACAIHCAVLPLILTSLPVFGINIIENKSFEIFMIGLAFAVGFYSLWHGYKKHHQKTKPLYIFSVGICLLIAKEVWHEKAIIFLIPAVLLIVLAHYLNIHYHPHPLKGRNNEDSRLRGNDVEVA